MVKESKLGQTERNTLESGVKTELMGKESSSMLTEMFTMVFGQMTKPTGQVSIGM